MKQQNPEDAEMIQLGRLDPSQLGTAKKSALIAMQLLRAIHEGVYKAGDKLPSERDLPEQLGVSRNPVREAMSALRLAGIVESRPGDGTFVKNTSRDLEFRVQEILKTGGSPLEAWEARKPLEPKVAVLAASQAIADDIASLNSAAKKMAEAITEGVAQLFLMQIESSTFWESTSNQRRRHRWNM